jgi:hypothetical protein
MAYTTIDDPSAHFITTLYTGDGNDDRSITNSANAGDFKPDWLWIKQREQTRGHALQDSNRGATKYLGSHTTSAENTNANGVQAFETNGFQLGTDTDINQNTGSYVAWQWKANGGTTSSNTDGSITSTVQANTTAGFSIVTYVSNNTEGATFGHGLSSAPEIVIIKGRDSADNWAVFNGTSTTNSRSLHLESTGPEIPVSSYNFWNLYWDETRPSSTVVTLGVDAKVNKSGNENFVAYCFHSVKGYSKIGKYKGNGSTDGAFVYTGFKPAWVLIKAIDRTVEWTLIDNARDTFNPAGKQLSPNASDREYADAEHHAERDFLSNGFKLRGTANATNASSSNNYVYMAFAENPFVSSKGVPVTAG